MLNQRAGSIEAIDRCQIADSCSDGNSEHLAHEPPLILTAWTFPCPNMSTNQGRSISDFVKSAGFETRSPSSQNEITAIPPPVSNRTLAAGIELVITAGDSQGLIN